MTALSALKRAIPPPLNTPSEVDWPHVESTIGVALPSDYKQLIASYGCGSFDDFLWVHHPTSTNPNLNLVQQVEERLWPLRVLRGERTLAGPGGMHARGVEEEVSLPYPLFPEPGGVLPWGATDNADVCYWLTTPDGPDAWPVLLNATRDPEDWYEFQGSLTEFLYATFVERRPNPIFPDDVPSSSPTFESVG
jgi:hypothetical protein